ncbi:MAG TPA: glycosyltransferase family 4 protein [Thermoanaerobaculia bacterium]|nr:glycosyltransferase family 4 protein [Thermoanaerobaculia bacterium]
MKPIRVLFTLRTLNRRTGSEAYVMDLARALRRRGHEPIVYASEGGDLAHELKMATVAVIERLDRMAVVPDLIHGNHHPETMTALLHFPDTPAIHVTHAWNSFEAIPVHHPRILTYVAVDDTCRDRLVQEEGIPPERVRVLQNGVDLDRFRPRAPLPAKPRRALVFSNYATPGTHLEICAEACRRAGIECAAIGSGVGREAQAPEQVIGGYDLIFAKARCALEAVAVGAAVVLCDATGSGPLITAANVAPLRRQNFGIRTMNRRLDADLLLGEIERYDPGDAAAVSRFIRETADLERSTDDLVALYGEVIEEHHGRPRDLLAESRAAADYLYRFVPSWRDTDVLKSKLGNAEAERDRMRGEIAYFQESATWKLRERILGWKPLAGAYRKLWAKK